MLQYNCNINDAVLTFYVIFVNVLLVYTIHVVFFLPEYSMI